MVTYNPAMRSQPITVVLPIYTVRMYAPSISGSATPVPEIGTTTPVAGDYLRTEGDVITLIAVPRSVGNVDYVFDFWAVGQSGSALNPYNYTVSGAQASGGIIGIRPYFKAVPSVPTTLTISAPATVTKGVAFATTGKLSRTDSGVGLGGQTVKLLLSSGVIGSATTASDGTYSISAAITVAGNYTLLASFEGVLGLGKSSASMLVGAGEASEVNWLPILGVGIAVSVAGVLIFWFKRKKRKR